jgi:flavodoxin
MACAVVFYSRGGNTKIAAEEIAKLKNATVFELKEKRGSRKGVFGFVKSGFQAITKKKTKVVNDFSEETKPFDTIYIGSPVWASNCTPAVNTYAGHADFSGKDVYLFFVCASKEADYKPQGGIDNISGMVKQKGGNLKGVYVFSGEYKKCITPEEMAQQVKKAI